VYVSPDSTTRASDDRILIVDWDGPDYPESRRKYAWHYFYSRVRLNWLLVCSWSFSKKWQATMIVSAFTFISPVSSSIIAPASNQLAERFDIHSSVLNAMTVSVFVLAYGENFHSHRRRPSLIARFRRRHHSLWALIPWPAQQNIWTLARFTTCQSVVSRYMLLLIPR
jgi:hypothetical protein